METFFFSFGWHWATFCNKNNIYNRSVMLHSSSINRRHSTSNPLLIGNICKLVPIEKWAKPWYWNHYYYYYYTQMSLAVGGWPRMNGERAERSSVGPLKKWIEKWNNISEIPRLRSILPCQDILASWFFVVAAEQTVRGADNKLWRKELGKQLLHLSGKAIATLSELAVCLAFNPLGLNVIITLNDVGRCHVILKFVQEWTMTVNSTWKSACLHLCV